MTAIAAAIVSDPTCCGCCACDPACCAEMCKCLPCIKCCWDSTRDVTEAVYGSMPYRAALAAPRVSIQAQPSLVGQAAQSAITCWTITFGAALSALTNVVKL